MLAQYTALELGGLISAFFLSLGGFVVGIINAVRTKKIDTAVNGQDSGQMTMVQHTQYTNKALGVMAEAQGVELPAKPAGDTA